MKLIRIFSLVSIIAFFMPFFNVSCNAGDAGVNFSGLDVSTGKYVGNHWQSGNLAGFLLVFAPAFLLCLSFFAEKKQTKPKIRNICLYIFYIAPIFDIFAVFVLRYAFKTLAAAKFGNIPVIIEPKPGFFLYAAANAALFASAVWFYFKNFRNLEKEPEKPGIPEEPD